MGIILNGILGKVSGKVAGVVGASWKDKAYLRAYVKPANPNTASQQIQRTRFSDTVNFCKALVGQVFNTYTDKFQKSMSGFNFFIKRNINVFDGSPSYDEIRLTEGTLSNPLIGSPTLSAGVMTIPWTKALGNNGSESDATFAVVYDKVTGVWYFAESEVARSIETMDVACNAVESGSDFECWIWCAQSVNSILESISNSSQAIGADA